MLYSPQQFSRDQLLNDLLTLKGRLEDPKAWLKGGFSREGSVCIVQAAKGVAQHEAGGYVRLDATNPTPNEVRLGRMILAVYRALLGPKAPLDVTASAAMRQIASFNDHSASTHASVMLLLDRAIATVLEPAQAAA